MPQSQRSINSEMSKCISPITDDDTTSSASATPRAEIQLYAVKSIVLQLLFT
jgi:hypothetical protein